MDGVGDKNDICENLLEALKAGGDNTDCVFMVGPDEGPLEEVHANKGTLQVSSVYMAKLFKSPLTKPAGPIRMKGVTPRIFRMLIEYLHFGVLPLTATCQDLLQLLIAADHFLSESLVAKCVNKLEQVLDATTVWPALASILTIDNLIPAAKCCIPVLARQTRKCLKQPAFLTSSASCVKFLLQQKTLALKDEMELVNFCLDWARNQEDPRKTFRSLFGLLNLAALNPKQVSKLPIEYFTPIEYQSLLCYSFRSEGEEVELPKALFPLVEPRKFCPLLKRKFPEADEQTILLVSDEMAKCFLTHETVLSSSGILNTVTIKPKDDIKLTRFSILGQIHGSAPKLVYNEDTNAFDKIPNTDRLMVSLKRNGQSLSQEQINCSDYTQKVILKTEIMLPRDQPCQLEFQLKANFPARSYLKKILCNEEYAAFVRNNFNRQFFEDVSVSVYGNDPIFVKDLQFSLFD